MTFITLYEDIIFIEGDYPCAELFGKIKVDLGNKFGAQLKSLRDVKKGLANQAKFKKCNAVINFTYGQKSRWLAIDDVSFWGKGEAAKLPQDIYEKLKEETVSPK